MSDEFVLTNTFYSGPLLADHADTLRKTMKIPHSISSTSLNQSIKSSTSSSSIQRTSAMKSSPSMKQLESILNQKSEPLSAATSAAASIPEVPEEYEEEVQVHLEEDEEEEVESKNKVPSASLFSNQSARESTNSVQSFHLSKSHTSSAVNRFSIATLDGDKTPVLQMTDGKFDNDETPKLERELERNERAVQEANDDDDANVTITDNNVIGSTEGNKLQKIDSVSPITNSSSSLLPAPTVPSETSPLITQTEKLDAATASIPKLNVESDKSEVSGNAELEPSPAFGKSMIPDYIPRIQPPAKNTPTTYTPSTIASTTTPKQTNNSTFDSPNTRPSIISTPRTPTPRSPYGRSNSTYSLNFKAQSEAVQEKTHKRSSTLGDLSSVVKEKGEAKAPSLKKFSFKSLFKKKSSVDEVPPITQPPRKSKKPRSFSSPNLSKYTEFPTTTTTSTTTTSDKGLDGKSTPSSQNLLQKSSSSFLNVFKKNKSSENLLALKKDPNSKASSLKNTSTPRGHTPRSLDQVPNDLLETPTSNREFLIREVNDSDYEGNVSSPTHDDLEDFYDQPAKKIYNNRYDHEMTITNQKLRSKGKKDPISPTIYSPPSSLAPPLMTLSRKQETKKTQALHVSPPRKTSSLYSAPAPLASPVPQTPVSNLDEDNDNDGIVDDNVPFVVPSLAPPPTTPSRFSRVLDDTTIFGSPFEVKYSPKETAIEDLQSRLSSRKDSKHHDQLLGEALFPKSLNAHEVESIVSLERSRSMRSFKSNKRNSFINYDGSNENIIQGDSSISLSSPGRQSTDINRSTSILKNSDSRRSLQIDTVMRAPTINDKNSKRNSKKVDETDKYSFEEGHNYDDFIEFQDFIDVENLDFSPQLSYAPSFSTSFDGDIESVPQTSTPIATPLISIVRGGEDVLRLKEVSAPVQEQEVTPVSAMAPISTPVPRLITPTTPSPIFAATPTSPISPVARSSSSIKSIPSPIKSSRIQLPKKISKDSFTKEIKEIPISKSKELPSLNTNTLEEVDEQPINAPLTPNLEKIETIPPISPSIHLESTNHYQSPSPVTSNVNSQAISRNIPEVNAQGKSNYNNRPISMSFKGLNGPSFQGKLQMQNIRSSSSHQSFNISFADSSDVGSSTGVMDSEFDDEDEDDDNDFGSGVGNGFGSDDDDDEDDIAAYSNRHIPNFVQPPSFHNGKMRSNNSSPRSAYNGHQQSPSQSSITSSPRSLGSLISRTWKKQGQLGMSVPPKQHTAVMPVQIRNGVRFSSRIVLYDTYNGDEYDRHPDTATCNQLTPMLAQQIKDELNVLKLNWYIHEQSRCYTHFM